MVPTYSWIVGMLWYVMNTQLVAAADNRGSRSDDGNSGPRGGT